jgi:acetolactate synthase-1/3 small subunit
MKHTLTALVENKPGVLARIIGVVSGRGYNIETLSVGPTQDNTCSKITMVVPGDDRVLEQVTLQVTKQIDVLRVTDVTRQRHISRELILVELATGKTGRAPVMELATLFSAQVVAVQASSLTLQYAGDEPQTADFLRTLRDFDVLDIARSGVIAVSRGNHDD